MFAWSKLDFSANPVSISAVSLTGRQTWQNVNSKRRLQKSQKVQEGKIAKCLMKTFYLPLYLPLWHRGR
jgi:hypothetical protein